MLKKYPNELFNCFSEFPECYVFDFDLVEQWLGMCGDICRAEYLRNGQCSFLLM